MLDFHSPKITMERVSDNHGVFVVEPLDRGFGYTFGNSLRRVLLSSLEGAAASAVKIDGVAHEFSTIPGVKEDVTDIILNLKKAVFVLHGEDDEIDVELMKDGPGVVSVGDISALANLEIVNPDAPLATLEDGARLEMVIWVRRGRGYVSADENKQDETILGVIPIDSIFSPVSRVAYRVEAARVGQRTDYDKLILEVETNGAVDPRLCLEEAANLLIEQLKIFADEDRIIHEDQEPILFGFPEPAGGGLDDMLIEELELGVRSYNCLKREGVETVSDLISRTEAELLNIPNFGKKSIEEVRERLAERDLKLRGE
ncbi:MAG TPA: DNA-directed RNA polymerase subunit alpha [Thermoleophilia bacterium]|nr:DNA-directed RNA polymerase subunit alpha [Thermoleophilia bacterium]